MHLRHRTQLRDVALDAAFVRLPVIDASDLTILEVSRDPLVAALPAGHRLARRRTLEPSNPRNERLVF